MFCSFVFAMVSRRNLFFFFNSGRSSGFANLLGSLTITPGYNSGFAMVIDFFLGLTAIWSEKFFHQSSASFRCLNLNWDRLFEAEELLPGVFFMDTFTSDIFFCFKADPPMRILLLRSQMVFIQANSSFLSYLCILLVGNHPCS